MILMRWKLEGDELWSEAHWVREHGEDRLRDGWTLCRIEVPTGPNVLYDVLRGPGAEYERACRDCQLVIGDRGRRLHETVLVNAAKARRLLDGRTWDEYPEALQ